MEATEFRVIGGPHGGAKWQIDNASDSEYLYIRAVDDCVEHIYELCLKSGTARYVKARRFQKECE